MANAVKARASAHNRDRMAAAVIKLAAFTVMGFTFLLLLYLVVEAWPLVKPAKLTRESSVKSEGSLPVWLAELPGTVWEVLPNGYVRLLPGDETVQLPRVVPPLKQALLHPFLKVLAVEDAESVKLFSLTSRVHWQGQKQVISMKTKLLAECPFIGGQLLAVTGGKGGAAVATKGGATYLLRSGEAIKLLEGETRVAALTDDGMAAWLATKEELLYVKEEKVVARIPLSAPPTAAALLIGDLTCLVGDKEGYVRAYNVFKEGSLHLLENIRVFSGSGSVLALTPSPRTKAFAILRPLALEIGFLTSGKRVAKLPVQGQEGARLVFSPRGERVLLQGKNQELQTFGLELGHPEVTLKTLFGKVQYEAHREPVWSWQSTGGSNAFESKFSLVPLILGSVKGAVWAMFFSAPLALLAALYTSQFAPASLRGIVKPVVELLAAVPSVVVGFLAAFIFGPWLAGHLEGVFLIVILLPAALLLTGKLIELRPRWWQLQFQRQWEGFVAGSLVLTTVTAALTLGPWIAKTLLGGRLLDVLQSHWGVTYDQRNALVAGFGLGFAVLPIIFTLADEALTNVPEGLVHAALSLGASRAKAAWTVVVPAALPGLVGALLLGFGRALGETMIVLMASGNAPLTDFSPLVGMRTMAANIAVELPEAPYGDSLYRVLLLVALLLFAFSFFINLAGQKLGSLLKRRFGVTA